MEVTLIDSRDATAEVYRPTYRVEIISIDGSRIDTWRLSGAEDFGEVLAWAETEKGNGSTVIHVEAPTGEQLTLLRLHGVPYGNAQGSGVPATASG